MRAPTFPRQLLTPQAVTHAVPVAATPSPMASRRPRRLALSARCLDTDPDDPYDPPESAVSAAGVEEGVDLG